MENVSERSTIIDCEYCSARIMLPELERKPKPFVPVEPVEPPDLHVESELPSFARIGIIAALVLVIPVVLIAFAIARRPAPSQVKVYATPYSTPYTSGTPSSWSWTANANTSDKPLPSVNYQPRMSWDGPNDLEHFEEPDVDISSLSDKTSEEIEKTVFKNRVVKLRVVINTEGEIDEVETISGHPILVAAATESAKSSIFTSRSKPTKRVLTYTFRVLKD